MVLRKSRLQIDGNFGCLKDRFSVCLKDGCILSLKGRSSVCLKDGCSLSLKGMGRSSVCLKDGSSRCLGDVDVLLWSSLSNLDLILEVASAKSEIYPLRSVRWLARQTNFYVKWLYVAKPLAPISLPHLSYNSRRNFEKRLFLKESNPYTLFNMKSKFFVKLVAGLNN